MITAKFHGSGRIELVDTDRPAPRRDEIMLRVEGCALCGSDKRLLENGAAVTPGHEIVGTVVDANGQEAPAVGQRVVVYIPLFCGRCEFCTPGLTNRCTFMRGLVGWQEPGGFQEYLTVPAGNALPVPEGIEPQLAVLALDTVGTSAHGLRMTSKVLGGAPRTAAVIGCGPLGLGSAVIAEALGVGKVSVADVQPARLQAAADLGFDVLDDKIKHDLVIEASGSPAARSRALDLVKPGGVILMLGEGSEPWVLPATPAWRRLEAVYLRSFYFPLTEVEDNWKLLEQNAARLERIIDRTLPVDDIEDTFHDFVQGTCVKPFVTMSTAAA